MENRCGEDVVLLEISIKDAIFEIMVSLCSKDDVFCKLM